MKNLINTDKNLKTQLLYEDITYKIRGAIFDVYNALGSGHKEKLYQNALAKEFDNLKIEYSTESTLKVEYKGKKIGNYRPDFVVEEKIILELKAVEFVTKTYETQILHYLKATGFKLGLLVNFGSYPLYIRRFVWTG